MTKIAITRLPHGKSYDLPTYATPGSAGVDLIAAIDTPVILGSLERTLVPTGIAIGLPEGFEAQVRPRSGLALKQGITLLNSPGTIDSDYRGEVKVIVVNVSKDNVVIEPGMRIAQMVIAPVSQVIWDEVKELNETKRAAAGFGSTGT